MANENLTHGNEKTSPLDPILTKLVGRREGERGEQSERGKKEEEESFRERSETISPSNPGETRAKLIPTARATHGYRYCGVSKNSGR